MSLRPHIPSPHPGHQCIQNENPAVKKWLCQTLPQNSESFLILEAKVDTQEADSQFCHTPFRPGLFLRAVPMRGLRSNTPMAFSRPTSWVFSSVQLETWKGSLGSLTSDTGNAQVATSDQRRFAWGQTWITPVAPISPTSIRIIFKTCSLKCYGNAYVIRSHCSTYANLKAHSHDLKNKRSHQAHEHEALQHTQQTTLYSPKRCFWFHSHLTLQVR